MVALDAIAACIERTERFYCRELIVTKWLNVCNERCGVACVRCRMVQIIRIKRIGNKFVIIDKQNCPRRYGILASVISCRGAGWASKFEWRKDLPRVRANSSVRQGHWKARQDSGCEFELRLAFV